MTAALRRLAITPRRRTWSVRCWAVASLVSLSHAALSAADEKASPTRASDAQTDEAADTKPAPIDPKAAEPPACEPPRCSPIDSARQTDAPERPKEAPLPAGEKRAVPNYDGREPPSPTLGDGLLWVPRVLFFPLFVVSEYVVRRPLGYAITEAERANLAVDIADFFTFGEERKVGVLPTALLDFGFRPSIGLYYFHNDFVGGENDFRAQLGWGGSNWFAARVADRYNVDDEQRVGVRGLYLERPDWVFHGIGPESPDSALGRYWSRSLKAELFYDAESVWRTSGVHALVGIHDVEFNANLGCCEDPTLQNRVDDGAYETPPGLSGYQVFTSQITAALDSRSQREPDSLPEGSDYESPPATGVRLAGRAAYFHGLDERVPLPAADPERYRWVDYGATLGGYLDVTGQQRTIGLSLIADFADPIEPAATIPFAELIDLGGDRPMRGFLEGRLLGRSSLVGRFEYRWPVWVWLDGTLQYEVGNVFGQGLRDFAFDKTRSSVGLGLRGNGSHDHVFELLFALGTETFEQGHGVDNVRIVFGASSGF